MTASPPLTRSVDRPKPLDHREVDALVNLLRTCNQELADWDQRLSAPHPPLVQVMHPPVDSPGGLPDGWRLVATTPNPMPDPADMHLVVRPAGGAMIVLHRRAALVDGQHYGHTDTMWFGPTPAAIYETLRENYDGTTGRGYRSAPQPHLAPYVKWMERVLVAMTDPTDEVETAEKMLFELSGVFSYIPRAAYTCQ